VDTGKLINDLREAIHLAERRAQDRRFGQCHWDRWRTIALNEAWAAARERGNADSELVDAIGDATLALVRERIEAYEDDDRPAVLRRCQADTSTLVRCEEAFMAGNELLTHFAKQTLREMAERYGLNEAARRG
jgi:hypothetical protein